VQKSEQFFSKEIGMENDKRQDQYFVGIHIVTVDWRSKRLGRPTRPAGTATENYREWG
jgi:hypothetical protein